MTKFDKRTVVSGAVGGVLQWYDFAVFGFFAPAISTQIFPADDPIAGLLKTFGIFAIGYLAQPVGGLLYGHLGDRISRRRALQISIVAMAIPTALISVLPTHARRYRGRRAAGAAAIGAGYRRRRGDKWRSLLSGRGRPAWQACAV